MTGGRRRYGEPEAAVLGGGVAGLTIAWELLRRGRKVVVLRSDRPAASMIAAGMLAPMAELALNQQLGRLTVEALRHYPEFLDHLAGGTTKPTGFKRSGVLRVAYSEIEALTLREGTGGYEAAGMPSRWLSPAACLREVPGLGEKGLSGGLLSFDEAHVQPTWLLAALEDAILSGGGAIESGEVTAVEVDGKQVLVRLAGGPDTTELRVANVVIALGSWSGLLPSLEYAIRPVKGQLLAFAAGTDGPGHIVYWGNNYLLTMPDGTVVLGATMEEAGFSTGADERAQELRGLLPSLWPAIADAPAEVRVGLRPATADGLPVIGPLPGSAHVYMFTAHFRNGFLLSPLTARLAVQEIIDGREAELLRPLRPQRLRTPAEAG